MKGEYPQAVDSALACLRLFGIDVPAQPTWEQAQAEYETLWRNLDGLPIENLIDLPLMSDPELQATMQALEALLIPAHDTDFHLFCLHLCLGVNNQLAARDERRVCDRRWAGSEPSLARSFAGTTMVIVSPSLHATWSRSTASSRARQKSTTRWD